MGNRITGVVVVATIYIIFGAGMALVCLTSALISSTIQGVSNSVNFFLGGIGVILCLVGYGLINKNIIAKIASLIISGLILFLILEESLRGGMAGEQSITDALRGNLLWLAFSVLTIIAVLVDWYEVN